MPGILLSTKGSKPKKAVRFAGQLETISEEADPVKEEAAIERSNELPPAIAASPLLTADHNPPALMLDTAKVGPQDRFEFHKTPNGFRRLEIHFQDKASHDQFCAANEAFFDRRLNKDITTIHFEKDGMFRSAILWHKDKVDLDNHCDYLSAMVQKHQSEPYYQPHPGLKKAGFRKDGSYHIKFYEEHHRAQFMLDNQDKFDTLQKSGCDVVLVRNIGKNGWSVDIHYPRPITVELCNQRIAIADKTESALEKCQNTLITDHLKGRVNAVTKRQENGRDTIAIQFLNTTYCRQFIQDNQAWLSHLEQEGGIQMSRSYLPQKALELSYTTDTLTQHQLIKLATLITATGCELTDAPPRGRMVQRVSAVNHTQIKTR